MMYRYWFVGTAILNKAWIEKYGTDWRAGRVEVQESQEVFPGDELFIIYRPSSPEFEDFIDDHPPTDKPLTVYELAQEWGGDIEIWEAPL